MSATFCTYLMAYTNIVLQNQFQAKLIYLKNEGGQAGFHCYTLAALFSGMIPYTLSNTKFRDKNGNLIEIEEHDFEEEIDNTDKEFEEVIYDKKQKILNLPTKTKWEQVIGWRKSMEI